MKTKTDFSLAFTQRQNIAILDSFQVDSKRLIAEVKRALLKHKFRVDEHSNNINFIYPIVLSTNEYKIMRPLRQGRIELI